MQHNQKISKEDVKKIIHLSRLEAEDIELQTFTSQLNAILNHFENLKEVNTDNLEITTLNKKSTFLREDETKKNYSREDFLNIAPETTEEFFLVPKIIEE